MFTSDLKNFINISHFSNDFYYSPIFIVRKSSRILLAVVNVGLEPTETARCLGWVEEPVPPVHPPLKGNTWNPAVSRATYSLYMAASCVPRCSFSNQRKGRAQAHCSFIASFFRSRVIIPNVRIFFKFV